MKKQIRFFQIEPQKILLDPEFQKMKPMERGIHFSLMMHSLYQGGGLVLDEKILCNICNCSSKSLLNFIAKHRKLYYKRKNRLYCVYSQFIIRKQKNFLQTCSESGLKGAQVTWGRHGKRNEKRSEIENENLKSSKRNESLNYNPPLVARDSSLGDSNSISTNALSRSSNSLRDSSTDSQACSKASALSQSVLFSGELNRILFAKSQSDRTCFRRVAQFLYDGCLSGKFTTDIFKRALEFAKEARSGEKPNALFMSLMRNQLGFERKPR